MFTIFRAGGDLPSTFRAWVKARLSGWSTMYSVVDAYGFAAGPDAQLAMIDLRTMEIIADQSSSLEEMIKACETLD